jgi:glycosyltransferase involved in cell wall biosynthesis
VAALSGRVPLVFTPHAFASSIPRSSRSTSAAIRGVERLIVRRADVVGAVSESEAAAARDLGARRVAAIPNGIPELDAPVSRAARRRHDVPPRVVAAGRLIDQRRPEACARILAGAADLAEIAWIGGGGPEGEKRDRALAALREAGATPTGWLPRERVLEELRASTVYLHWTAWDGQALSLLEALACDAVAVASDVAPNREVLGPRQLCSTEEEAIALLRQILTDPQLAEELLADQRQRGARHSATTMVSRWAELYEELAPARARARNQRRSADENSPLYA